MIKLMVHPKDVDESLLIQKAAFAAGYMWPAESTIPRKYPVHWLTFRPEEKIMNHAHSARFTAMADFTEKTVAEILHMLGERQDIDCTIPEGET